jgi:hypothetical protein
VVTNSPKAADDTPNLRTLFAERRISLRTMDAPLRLATGGAGASMIGAIALVALRDAGGVQVVLPVTQGVRTTLSGALFVSALVLMALGFGYLTTGAVLAHRNLALAAVLVLTGVLGFETGVFGIGGIVAPLPPWARLTTRLLLAGIWALAIAATLVRRGRPGDAGQDAKLRTVLLIAYCGLYGGYLLVLRGASPNVNGLDNFPISVNLLMLGAAMLSLPILQIAAVDFGEWGQLTGERLLRAAGRTTGAAFRSMVPGLGCLTLLVIAWVTQRGTAPRRLVSLGHGVLVFAAAVFVLLLVGRVLRLGRQNWPRTLNFGGLLAVTAVTAFLIAPVSAALTGRLAMHPAAAISRGGFYTGAANVRTLGAPAGASLLVPTGWQSSTGNGNDTYFDIDPNLGPLVLTVARGRIGAATLPSIVSGLGRPLGPAVPDGPMTRLELVPRSPVTTSIAWLEPIPGASEGYLLVGSSRGSDQPGAVAQFEAIAHSFRLPGVTPARIPSVSADQTSAAAQQAADDRLETVSDLMRGALAVIGLILLFAFGRGWPGGVRATLLLFGTVTLFTTVTFANALGRVLDGPGATWPTLGVTGVLAGIGVLGLLMLGLAATQARPWARRLPANLTALTGGIIALRLLDTLYTNALTASRAAVWAAVILLLAITWDVAMSGESMTNRASKYLPRASRVLLFYGYVILLAAVVVYFTGQRSAGSGRIVAEAVLEPEAITQAALFGLAMPLLVLLFLLHTFGGVSAPGTVPGQAAGAAVVDMVEPQQVNAVGIALQPISGTEPT